MEIREILSITCKISQQLSSRQNDFNCCFGAALVTPAIPTASVQPIALLYCYAGENVEREQQQDINSAVTLHSSTVAVLCFLSVFFAVAALAAREAVVDGVSEYLPKVVWVSRYRSIPTPNQVQFQKTLGVSVAAVLTTADASTAVTIRLDSDGAPQCLPKVMWGLATLQVQYTAGTAATAVLTTADANTDDTSRLDSDNCDAIASEMFTCTCEISMVL